MIRTLGSLIFYARFAREFSVLGYRRASKGWPALEADFSGQTWLVTGATGGIGRAVALSANHCGARVLAAARSEEKLRALKEEATAPRRLIPLCSDLSLMADLDRIIRERSVGQKPIDVLVNNVGVLLNEHSTTAEGLETSFATNILGPYRLTESLQTGGRFADGALVINVSSGGMYGTPLRLNPMAGRDPRRFDGMAAYAMHKRAMVVLTRYWNERWRGQPTVQVMHPGWVDTAGVQTALPIFRRVLGKWLRNAEQGADTILWLAAERPALPSDGGIWLDRALKPEHEFALTRKSEHDPEELAAFLDRMARNGDG
jgi:NAD(P)-dependent dehydrogenase (short-subunit alcohol dehydrogenase family)